MLKRLVGAAAIASMLAALALPSFASASTKAGERSFAQTFPVASKLCNEVTLGKRKHLIPVATAILADCATLNTNFTGAQTAVVTSRTTIAPQIAADRSAIKTACPTPSDQLKPACVSARHTQNAAIKVLRSELLAAVHAYYKTIESNRHTFWAAIKTLRPLRHAVGDKPIKEQNS
jgi:type II secretory pathway pseudopilin PulG